MTVASIQTSVQYPGNGAQSVFNYNFLIPFQQDGVTPAVAVYYQDPTGAVSLLAPTQYTITGVGNASGGLVTYLPGGTPIPNLSFLTIQRAALPTQDIVVANQGFYPSTVEAMDDYITMVVQQIYEKQTRGLYAPPGEGAIGMLPSKLLRSGSYLAFDSNGNPIAATGGAGGGVSTSVAWGNITGKPGTFPATPTDHSLITDFNAAVDSEINAHLAAGAGVTLTTVGGQRVISAAGGGGGAVSSVNLKTGAVLLKSTDIAGNASVKDYGAVCDGTTDDTAAVNLAIAAINAGTINSLFFPGHTGVVGSLTVITKPCTLWGTGHASSSLVHLSGGDVLMLSINLATGSTYNKISIHHMSLLTKQANLGQALRLRNFDYLSTSNMSDVNIQGWASDQTLGWNRGANLVNCSNATFENVNYYGPVNFGFAYPASVMVAAYAWKLEHEAGGGPGCVNNRWTNCDVYHTATAWLGTMHMEGLTWVTCCPVFVGSAWDIRVTNVDNPNAPYFEWVNCQSEFFVNGIYIDNASYIVAQGCVFINNADLNNDRTSVTVSNCVWFNISNNVHIGGNNLGSTSFFRATNACNLGRVSGNMLATSATGPNGKAYWLTGTSQNIEVRDESVYGVTAAALIYKNDSSNAITNRRRGMRMWGPSAAQGPQVVGYENNTPLTVSVAGGQIAPVQIAFGVEIGDKLRLSIAAFYQTIASAEAAITTICREYTHRPASGSPFTVFTFANSRPNWQQIGHMTANFGQWYVTYTIDVDVIAAASDAVISVESLAAINDCTMTWMQLKVERV